MRYKIADDARPQIKLLLLATAVTIVLWFIPFAEYVVYPVRLFVTFIHESAHALAAVLTGGSVQSLTISADGSGVVYSASPGFLSGLITASAGYLGAMLFGVLLLYLLRRSVSPNKVLAGLGIFVGIMTLVFTVISPIFHFLWLNASLSSIVFTVLAGGLLAAALLALGKFGSVRAANFAVAFLAVQCILNALSDLKTVLLINTPLIGSGMHNDAANMAAATGIPGVIWVIAWIGLSIAMISLGLRLYTVGRNKASTDDSVFEDAA